MTLLHKDNSNLFGAMHINICFVPRQMNKHHFSATNAQLQSQHTNYYKWSTETRHLKRFIAHMNELKRLQLYNVQRQLLKRMKYPQTSRVIQCCIQETNCMATLIRLYIKKLFIFTTVCNTCDNGDMKTSSVFILLIFSYSVMLKKYAFLFLTALLTLVSICCLQIF